MIVINARFLTQRITGVQRYASELSRELKKRCPEIVCVAPRNILHDELANELGTVTGGVLKGHMWEQLELPECLRRMGNALLLNPGNTGPLGYTQQLTVIHSLAYLHREWYSMKFHMLYSLMIPLLMRTSKKIVTVSEFMMNEILHTYRFLKKEKISFVYPGISDEFSTSQSPCVRKNYILCVGSNTKSKNIVTLICAFLTLHDASLRLIIAGDINSSIFKTEKYPLSNHISFLGHVSTEELIRLYREASLLVFPSLYESFGFPAVEAMACGCPVVVSNVASLREVCGDAAYYVNPSSAESIAEGIYKVLADSSLRESLTQKGLERAKLFSWERAAKAHIELFKEIIGNGGVSE
jgi:glycosyltransferase involved in cell wall biosynthesis